MFILLKINAVDSERTFLFLLNLGEDNGIKCVSFNRELREALKDLNQDKIQKALLQDCIKWRFNTPNGAHHAGVCGTAHPVSKECSSTRHDAGLMAKPCKQFHVRWRQFLMTA